MRKIIAAMISVSMLVAMLPNMVMASSYEEKTIFENDFSQAADLDAVTDTNDVGISIDDITYAGKSVLKFQSSSSKYADIKFPFSQDDYVTPEGKSVFIDYAFDMKADMGSGGASLNLKLSVGSKAENIYVSKNGGIYLSDTNSANDSNKLGDNNKTDYPLNSWNSYRIRFQLTDDNGDPVNKFVKVYIKPDAAGSEKDITVNELSANQTVSECKYLGFYLSKKNGATLWADNVKITKYSNVDKAALNAKMSELDELLADADGVVDAGKLAEYTSEAQKLRSANSYIASAAEAEEAVEAADKIVQRLEQALLPAPDFKGEGFDDKSELPTELTGTSGLVALDTATYAKDSFYNKTVKLTGAAEAAAYAEYSFSPTPADSKNMYSELSFDVKGDNVKKTGSNINITIGDDVAGLCITPNGKLLAGGDEIATCTADDWHNIRLIAQLTDADKAAVNEIKAIFVDGEAVGPAAPIAFGADYTALESIKLSLDANSGEFGLWADNFAVYSYSSADGSSPIVNKAGLKAAISKAERELLANENLLTDSDYAEIEAKIKALRELYAKDITADEATSAKADAADISNDIQTGIQNNPEAVKGFTTVYAANFEEGTSMPAGTDGTAVVDSQTHKEDLFHNNAATLIGGADSQKLTFNIDEVLPQGKNRYAEVSFDIKTQNSSTSGVGTSINLGGSVKGFYMTEGGKLYAGTGTSDPLVASFGSTTTWRNIKFVMQLTDSQKELVSKIVDIIVDGKSVLEVESEPFKSVSGTIKTITVSFGSKKDGFQAWVDNFEVNTYKSEDGTSAIPDKSIIAANGTNIYNNANTHFTGTEKYNEIMTRLNACIAVYLSKDASKADLLAAIEACELLNKEVEALVAIKNEGKESYIYPPEISSADFTADTVTVSIAAAAGDNAAYNTTMAAVLYEDNGLCGGRVLEVKSDELNAAKQSMDKASCTFDLTAYPGANRSKLFIKLMLVDDISQLSISNSEIYGFNVPTSTFNTADYSFEQAVNAGSKIISNSEQKIVISVNAGKDNAGKLITVAIFDGTPSAAQPIENTTIYLNQAIADKDGYAVFEAAPTQLDRDYAYSVRYGEALHTGTINYSNATTVNNAFSAVTADKTAIAANMSVLQIDKNTYDNAVANGVDTAAILEEVLNEKSYDAYSVDEFANSANGKLSLVTGVKTAVSADIIGELIAKYNRHTTAAATISSLNATQLYKLSTAIYDRKAGISNMATLNKAVADAIVLISATTPTTKPSSGGGGGGGGGSVTVGATQTVPLEKPQTPVQTMAAAFNDLDSVAWAEQAILALAALNCISGKAAQVFAPQDNITREEFVKIAVMAYGLYDANARASFADIAENDWCNSYVASAVNAGIIYGVDENNFGKGQLITRQDMAVIIYRLMQKYNGKLTEDGVYIEFSDEGKFASYSTEAIIALAKSGIVNGVGGNAFMPLKNSTRAEAAKVIYEAYKRK